MLTWFRFVHDVNGTDRWNKFSLTEEQLVKFFRCRLPYGARGKAPRETLHHQMLCLLSSRINFADGAR